MCQTVTKISPFRSHRGEMRRLVRQRFVNVTVWAVKVVILYRDHRQRPHHVLVRNTKLNPKQLVLISNHENIRNTCKNERGSN